MSVLSDRNTIMDWEAIQIRQLVDYYYDVQKLRISVFNRLIAYIKLRGYNVLETQEENASQTSLKKVKVTLKPSEIAKEMTAGKCEVPPDLETYVWLHNNLYAIEKEFSKTLDKWSKDHPIRIHFLNRVQGIGGVLASGVIAWLSPISRFPNISKLWKYCGLAPGQRRVRGQPCGYNPKLKSLMWKIATSFEKQNPEKSFYRRIYEQKKKYYMEREDIRRRLESGEKGVQPHVRMMTLRYTVKRFLADLWVQWRKLEGLPITKPYAHGVLGHTEYIEWQPDK